jgi:hypothetical protein
LRSRSGIRINVALDAVALLLFGLVCSWNAIQTSGHALFVLIAACGAHIAVDFSRDVGGCLANIANDTVCLPFLGLVGSWNAVQTIGHAFFVLIAACGARVAIDFSRDVGGSFANIANDTVCLSFVGLVSSWNAVQTIGHP